MWLIMRCEIRIVGSGGQGVILSGIILTQALGIYEDFELVQTQSYGPESRGGACKTELIVSNKKIDYIKVENPNYLIAFNQFGFNRYKDNLADNPYILIDSTLINKIPINFKNNNNLFRVKATSIAEKELKSFVANMVMLGAMAKITDIISYKSLVQAIKDILDPSFHDLNIKALQMGYERAGV